MSASATQREFTIGVFSALGVLCIWSGFIVFSRAGILTGLTVFDVTALRFLVAGLLVLPFAWHWWPRHLPWRALILMCACGPGAIYTVLMYLGLKETSAAYGGVFANGFLPIFTMLIALVITRDRPDRHQFLAIATIVLGALLVGLPGMRAGGVDVIAGIGLFLSASAVLSIYIFGVKYWRVEPLQALALVTLPNALIFVPLWYGYLPTEIGQVDWQHVLFQGLFQGLGPGFLAVILFANSVRYLGSSPTAGLAAAVPATSAVLAIPVLAELPSLIEWIGIGVVSMGLFLLLVRPFAGK